MGWYSYMITMANTETTVQCDIGSSHRDHNHQNVTVTHLESILVIIIVAVHHPKFGLNAPDCWFLAITLIAYIYIPRTLQLLV